MNKVYCPVCGQPMTVDGEVVMPKSGRTFLQITCDTPKCQAYRATASDVSVKDGSFATAWKLKVKFDVNTGEVLK